jgi:hypothetical protein
MERLFCFLRRDNACIFKLIEMISLPAMQIKRALFIGTQNRLRSPTAENVFASWPGVETDSAGLGNDANVPLG